MQRAEDLAEYQAKYQEDLMVRLSQRNQREMVERFERSARDQKKKEAAATGNGNIKLVEPLAEAEMRDFVKARAVLEAQEEEDTKAEVMLNSKRNQQLKIVQMENFQKLVESQATSTKQRDLA